MEDIQSRDAKVAQLKSRNSQLESEYSAQTLSIARFTTQVASFEQLLEDEKKRNLAMAERERVDREAQVNWAREQAREDLQILERDHLAEKSRLEKALSELKSEREIQISKLREKAREDLEHAEQDHGQEKNRLEKKISDLEDALSKVKEQMRKEASKYIEEKEEDAKQGREEKVSKRTAVEPAVLFNKINCLLWLRFFLFFFR